MSTPSPVRFAIVTPNHLHCPVAKMALELGVDVVSDKPATATLADGLRGLIFIETAVRSSAGGGWTPLQAPV